MKPVWCLLIGVCIVASLSAQTQQQDRWAKYQPRTLQSIIDEHESMIGKEDKLLLSAESFPSRVTLTYLGKSRPLTGKRKELLEAWKRMGKGVVRDDVVELFATEMLFREGNVERWIAIQKPLVAPLPKEVQVGEVFTGYIVWMGAIRDENHWEWLFAMNEFDSPAQAPAVRAS
ncbi:MAG: hypothetical protein ACM3JB_00595 [Acidobacteriaceae bacterium]